MTTETIETNVDANTISKEMTLKAAYEVLDSKQLFVEMLEENSVDDEVLAGWIEMLKEIETERKSAKKKIDELSRIQTLIETGILSQEDFKLMFGKKAKTPKASGSSSDTIKFKHFFVTEKGDIKTGEFAATSRLPTADNPKKFFDWAKSDGKDRADFRTDKMSPDQMDDIAIKYLEHIKPAV